MKTYATRWLSAVTALSLLTACAVEQQEAAPPDYKEVKDMVVDILKTEDGQKAIEEAQKKAQGDQQSETMKILQTGQGMQLKMAVKEVLSDPAYSTALKEMMVDPKFAGDFAKALNKEVKDVHKDLLKDPKYREALIEVLKDPKFTKIMMDTMKSTEYRQQIMTVMNDTLQSPLVQAELIKLMQKALEEQAKPKKKDKAAGEAEGGGGS
ncbi:spore germination lipoprotein GerD [Paenibacillus alkalitolerans]|uniref:spore germination lipoprotein GerD n=1 Tax=Paenibacillus alkalitolerans TaxID=2799335 RepID=UPI0018F76DFB|nr:spore germination lipoprotein GerD [Paenibacillus alkalitolerans]